MTSHVAVLHGSGAFSLQSTHELLERLLILVGMVLHVCGRCRVCSYSLEAHRIAIWHHVVSDVIAEDSRRDGLLSEH